MGFFYSYQCLCLLQLNDGQNSALHLFPAWTCDEGIIVIYWPFDCHTAVIVTEWLSVKKLLMPKFGTVSCFVFWVRGWGGWIEQVLFHLSRTKLSPGLFIHVLIWQLLVSPIMTSHDLLLQEWIINLCTFLAEHRQWCGGLWTYDLFPLWQIMLHYYMWMKPGNTI